MKVSICSTVLVLLLLCLLAPVNSFRLRRESEDYAKLVAEPNDPGTYSRANYRKFMLDIFRNSNKGNQMNSVSHSIDDPKVDMFMERITEIVDQRLDDRGLNYYSLSDIIADSERHLMQKMMSDYNYRYGNNEL